MQPKQGNFNLDKEGSRKSFHNVQRCAKIFGFAFKETSRKHQGTKCVANVSSFCCTEASPFASVEDLAKHLTKFEAYEEHEEHEELVPGGAHPSSTLHWCWHGILEYG